MSSENEVLKRLDEIITTKHPATRKAISKSPRRHPQKPSRKVRENATTAWSCGMPQRLSHSTAPTQPDSGLPIET